MQKSVSCPYCDSVVTDRVDSPAGYAYRCDNCHNVFTQDEIKARFHSWDSYADEAIKDIFVRHEGDMCKYPIKYLDDALLGIAKSELVVIGSDTGVGKSQLLNDLAFTNARMGKQVYLFSLEGDKYEVAHREIYKQVANKYYKEERSDQDMSYRRFVFNKLEGLEPEMLEVVDQMKNKYRNLHIYTRFKPLDIDTLAEQMELIKSDADLVILDHLHYFSFDESEHIALTKIMQKIQQLKTTYRVPIVLASHLRKKGKDRVFPDNNDFHGTSNIAKQADTCIILAPIHFGEEDDDQFKSGVYPTGIRITKGRHGISQKLVGVTNFDLNRKTYEDDYYIAVVGFEGVRKLDTSQYPRWARKIVNWSDSFTKKDKEYFDG